MTKEEFEEELRKSEQEKLNIKKKEKEEERLFLIKERELEKKKKEEEEEERNISLETEREFEYWYAAFPKHVGKGQARRSYRAARRKTSAEILLAGAKRAATTFTDPRFTPHPSTWLNGERWLDADALGEPARPAYDWDADPANKGVH